MIVRIARLRGRLTRTNSGDRARERPTRYHDIHSRADAAWVAMGSGFLPSREALTYKCSRRVR